MSKPEKIRVNNGWRAEVDFGPYIGTAGIVDRDGIVRVAFFADFKQMERVTSGTIGSEEFAVTSVVKSDPGKGGVKGMVVLTVTPAGAPAA